MILSKANLRNLYRKISIFGVMIPVYNLLLTYGRRLPDRLLSIISEKRNKTVRKILSPIVDSVAGLRNDNMADDSSRTIWICWLQGEDTMPLLVKMCMQSIYKFANGHPVVVLTEKNYHQYVSIGEHIVSLYQRGKIKPAHFADIIRVNLLAQKGGLWLDATMFLTAPLDGNIFEKPFYSIKILPYGHFVSKCRWSVFCIAANRGNELMSYVASAFDRYCKKYDTFVDYFMFDQLIDLYCRKYPHINELINTIERSNPDLYKLTPLLCDTFNADSFKALTTETTIFKLNWKKYTDEQLLSDPNNYFAHLSRFME